MTRQAIASAEGEPLIRVSIATQLAVALIKSLAPADAVSAPLRPVAEGLAKQPVQVSALVGRCALALSDFAGLAAGDLIVLDRELTRPLDLMLDHVAPSGRCTVEQEGDHLRLKIIATEFGKASS